MKTTESIKVVPARYPMRTAGAVIALFVPGGDYPVRGV